MQHKLRILVYSWLGEIISLQKNCTHLSLLLSVGNSASAYRVVKNVCYYMEEFLPQKFWNLIWAKGLVK